MTTQQEDGVREDGESLDTVAVHGGDQRPEPEDSVILPIHQGMVYEVDPGNEHHDLKYSRLNSTPSQNYLDDKLAAIEGCRGRGGHAVRDGGGDHYPATS